MIEKILDIAKKLTFWLQLCKDEKTQRIIQELKCIIESWDKLEQESRLGITKVIEEMTPENRGTLLAIFYRFLPSSVQPNVLNFFMLAGQGDVKLPVDIAKFGTTFFGRKSSTVVIAALEEEKTMKIVRKINKAEHPNDPKVHNITVNNFDMTSNGRYIFRKRVHTDNSFTEKAVPFGNIVELQVWANELADDNDSFLLLKKLEPDALKIQKIIANDFAKKNNTDPQYLEDLESPFHLMALIRLEDTGNPNTDGWYSYEKAKFGFSFIYLGKEYNLSKWFVPTCTFWKIYEKGVGDWKLDVSNIYRLSMYNYNKPTSISAHLKMNMYHPDKDFHKHLYSFSTSACWNPILHLLRLVDESVIVFKLFSFDMNTGRSWVTNPLQEHLKTKVDDEPSTEVNQTNNTVSTTTTTTTNNTTATNNTQTPRNGDSISRLLNDNPNLFNNNNTAAMISNILNFFDNSKQMQQKYNPNNDVSND